jgi:hypothetical protein
VVGPRDRSNVESGASRGFVSVHSNLAQGVPARISS